MTPALQTTTPARPCRGCRRRSSRACRESLLLRRARTRHRSSGSPQHPSSTQTQTGTAARATCPRIELDHRRGRRSSFKKPDTNRSPEPSTATPAAFARACGTLRRRSAWEVRLGRHRDTKRQQRTHSATSGAATRPRADAPLPWARRRPRSVAKRPIFGVMAGFAVCSVDLTLFSLVGVVKWYRSEVARHAARPARGVRTLRRRVTFAPIGVSAHAFGSPLGGPRQYSPQVEALQTPQKLRDLPRVSDTGAPRPHGCWDPSPAHPAPRCIPTPAPSDRSDAYPPHPTDLSPLRRTGPPRGGAGRVTGAGRRCSRRAARDPRYCSTIIPINSSNRPVQRMTSPYASANTRRQAPHPPGLPPSPTSLLTSEPPDDPHPTPRPDAQGSPRDAPKPQGHRAAPAPHRSAPAPARHRGTRESSTARRAPAHATPSPPGPPPQAPARPARPPLQQRHQTRLAVTEQLIERPPRHPRPRGDPRHRGLLITQLVDHRRRRDQQPRTLNLIHLHPRRVQRQHRPTRPAHRPPLDRPRTLPHTHTRGCGIQHPPPRGRSKAGANAPDEEAPWLAA